MSSSTMWSQHMARSICIACTMLGALCCVAYANCTVGGFVELKAASSQYLNSSFAINNSVPLTLDALIKIPSYAAIPSDGSAIIYNDGGGGVCSEATLLITSALKLRAIASTNTLSGGECGAMPDFAESSSVLPRDIWVHVTGVFQESVAHVYINGVLEGSATRQPNFPSTNAIGFIIGSYRGTASFFSGFIAFVRVWSRDLDAVEISELHHVPICSSDDVLVNVSLNQSLEIYWKLNVSDRYCKLGPWVYNGRQAFVRGNPNCFLASFNELIPAIAGTFTITNRNCDNSLKKDLSPFSNPCSSSTWNGGRQNPCVPSINECASLAATDPECSLVTNYYGNSSGPSGNYAGWCSCVKVGKSCGGWKEAGGNVFTAVLLPTASPTMAPTQSPTFEPTVEPTFPPTFEPTIVPTAEPTLAPTAAPTAPTAAPTQMPSSVPTPAPTSDPTLAPTFAPTVEPTLAPTAAPTDAPTAAPTQAPSSVPTSEPTSDPTLAPTFAPTVEPTLAPTAAPTDAPTAAPTQAPSSVPTSEPTSDPTLAPTVEPTFAPTVEPTLAPTAAPTDAPTAAPTLAPSSVPTPEPTSDPTLAPTVEPTFAPTVEPTLAPTAAPFDAPTGAPTQMPSSVPTPTPTSDPTRAPTFAPTVKPTLAPTAAPTDAPRAAPTQAPSSVPTPAPTSDPTFAPTFVPTVEPTVEPTLAPSDTPAQKPSVAPTEELSSAPAPATTPGPTVQSTLAPTAAPIDAPTHAPMAAPTKSPSSPTQVSSSNPTSAPTYLSSQLNARVAEQNKRVLALIEGNQTRAVLVTDNSTLFVQKLSAADLSADGAVAVQLAEGIKVSVPSSVLEQLGGNVVMAIDQFHEGTFPFANAMTAAEESGKPIAQVTGVIDFSLSDPTSGARIAVANLVNPIMFSLPINRTGKESCVFWDEVVQSWSSQGVSIVSGDLNSYLQCATTHLSFFGSIWSGVLKQLICSNINILIDYRASYQELATSQWYYEIGAALVWVLVATTLTLFAATIALDCYRHHSPKGWRDEYFLIPLEDTDNKSMHSDGLLGENSEQTHCCFLGFIVLMMFHSSSELYETLRDITEEILGALLGDFWYIYIFVREHLSMICEAYEGGFCRNLSLVAVAGAIRKVAEGLSSRVACGETLRSAEDLELVREGLDLTRNRRASNCTKDENVALGALNIHDMPQLSFKTMHTIDLMTSESEHLHRFDSHFETSVARHSSVKSLRSLPRMFAMVLVNELPLAQVFVQSLSTPSSMRFLLCMAESAGTLMLVTLFTSGAAHRKRASSASQNDQDSADSAVDSACIPQDWQEELGKVILIGVAAGVLCVVPKVLISRFHNRKFMHMDYRGSKSWNRQLRVWRFMDVWVWIFGVAYVIWCFQFALLFVASIEPQDQADWLVSAFLSVAEDAILIPSGLAILIPILVILCNHGLAYFHRRSSAQGEHPPGQEKEYHNEECLRSPGGSVSFADSCALQPEEEPEAESEGGAQWEMEVEEHEIDDPKVEPEEAAPFPLKMSVKDNEVYV